MGAARNLPRPTGPHVGVVVQLGEKHRIQSEANLRGHWAKRATRASEQRQHVRVALLQCIRPLLPCLVRIVRVFPKGFRRMDDDNLIGGCKAIRDQIAIWLGCDDGDDRVRFLCEQYRSERPGEHAVAIYVEPVEFGKAGKSPVWPEKFYPVSEAAHRAKLRELWAEIMDDNLRSVGMSPMPPDARPKRDILEVHRELREVIGKLAATAREITGKPARAVKSRGGRP